MKRERKAVFNLGLLLFFRIRMDRGRRTWAPTTVTPAAPAVAAEAAEAAAAARAAARAVARRLRSASQHRRGPHRNLARAINRTSGANQSTIPGARRRRRPPRGETDPHGVCSDVNDRLPLVQVNRLTHAREFTRDAYDRQKISPRRGRRGDAKVRKTQVCDVHLDPSSKPGIKGEDWESHAIGPAYRSRSRDVPPVRRIRIENALASSRDLREFSVSVKVSA